MIKVYGIKNCDSVKKALSFLKKNSLEYELHDFKTQKVSCHEVKTWLKRVELKILFNSRSTTYRNLKLKEKNLNDNEKISWLCKENLLIKRPVITYKDKVLVSFDEIEYTKVFL